MGVDESNIEELGDIEAHPYYVNKNGYTESKVLTLFNLPLNVMFITLFFVRTTTSKNYTYFIHPEV